MSNTYTLRDRDIITHHTFLGGKKYIGRIRDLPDSSKPREKLIAQGPDALTTPELLAIVFGMGTKKENVMEMTHRILKEYGDKGLAHETKPEKLVENLNIPMVRACQIIACFSLGRRIFQRQGGEIYVRSAEDAYQYLKDMHHLPKEQLRGLYLNSRYQLIHDEVISIGTLTSNVVHPREVFRPALQYAAAAIIIAHNHPSGDTTPTEADLEITQQLIQAGGILGIDILDHIIVSVNGFTSIDAPYET